MDNKIVTVTDTKIHREAMKMAGESMLEEKDIATVLFKEFYAAYLGSLMFIYYSRFGIRPRELLKQLKVVWKELTMPKGFMEIKIC